MKYNGWNNHETWCANLWLDNSGYQEMISEEAGSILAINDNDRDSATYDLSQYIDSLISDMCPDLGSSMFSDLLNSAVSEIDTYEIAEHYISDIYSEEVE